MNNCEILSSLALLHLLGNVGSNSIHVGDALSGESLTPNDILAILIKGDSANDLSILELLEAVSDALTSGESRVLSADTVSLLARVVLSQLVDTSLLSHVELVSNGGSSDVEPVLVVRRQVLIAGGFVVDGPLNKN